MIIRAAYTTIRSKYALVSSKFRVCSRIHTWTTSHELQTECNKCMQIHVYGGYTVLCIEDITCTRWWGDRDVIFQWQEHVSQVRLPNGCDIFLLQEDKIHFSKLLCEVLFIIRSVFLISWRGCLTHNFIFYWKCKCFELSISIQAIG